MSSPSSGELTVPRALVLGAVQGPAELLPISSSAHVSAVSWMLGWDYDELDPGLRKSFEVALHTGTALALTLAARPDPMSSELDGQRLLLLGVSSAPAALAGYAWESEIESALGTPRTIAAALIAGAVLMALADQRPQARRRSDARPRDGLWLGLAQAFALVPGVSRTGATHAAARWLGFRRADAKLLADQVGLPVLLGASLLKALRLRQRRLEARAVRPLAAGAAASCACTLACEVVARRGARYERLLPFAVYRLALASWMLTRLRRGSTARPPTPPPSSAAIRLPTATARPAQEGLAAGRRSQPRP